ncbi:MAG: AtpZ/AtpI family protein [Gemmatirosa sp.]
MNPEAQGPNDPERAGRRQEATADERRRKAAQADGSSGLALAGLGFQFAVSLVVFYYLGQWLDRRFGTAPVFLLVSMVLGAGASFYFMYSQLMRAQRRADDARRGDPAP